MIDKINVNSGYDYPNHNNQRKNAAVQAYENTPGTKEAGKQRAGQKKQSSSYANAKKQGVILDISSQQAEEHEHVQKQSKAGFSLTSMLQKVFSPAKQAVSWIKNFWRSGAQGMEDTLKNNAAAQNDNMDELPPLDTLSDRWESSGTDDVNIEQENSISAAENERTLQKALKSANLQQIEQLLTQNGTKHLAHNSDLLTYYDRKGMLVEMDETEKHRVLFGDKNVLKL